MIIAISVTEMTEGVLGAPGARILLVGLAVITGSGIH